MKKLLTVLLTLLMVFTLVGCNSKEDTPVVQEPEKQEVVEETKEEPEIVGGYIDVEDGTLTDDLKDIFAKALEGLLGATYEPQELVATQVVAGTNYKFLANGTKTTNPITKGIYYIYVNKDLQGNVSLLDIETIEEKQEEKKTVDPTQYSYWVVVYDQFDNEISRTTAKYGTTVKDPDGNNVVVIGNTYFHTVIDYSPAVVVPTPIPDPTPSSLCSNTNDLYYFTWASYDGWASWNTHYTKYKYNGSGFNYGIDYTYETIGGPSSNIEELKWYHSSDRNTFVECTDPNHHQPYGHVCSKTSTYLLHVLDGDCNADVYQWNPSSSSYEFVENKLIDWSYFDPFVFSEAWIHTNDVDNPGSGSQTECDDHKGHVIS